MRDALLVSIAMFFGWMLGYLVGAARTRASLKAVGPSREAAPKSANGHRKVEIMLRKIEPCGMGKINLYVTCLLCETQWRYTDAGHTDNVWLNCPRCGARETSDDVRAALREELRSTLADAPPESM